MSDLFNELLGNMDSPGDSVLEAPHENVAIGAVDEEDTENEGEYSEENMTEYFSTVPEEEAMNYISMLRAGNFILFDHFDRLKGKLLKTESLGEI